MKYVVFSLLSVSLLFAGTHDVSIDEFGTELPGNRSGYTAPPGVLDPTTLEDINDPTSNFEYLSPVERAVSVFREDEDYSEWPDYDWADDVTVYAGRVGTGQDFDVDETNGNIFAIFDTDLTTGDSLLVYRSTDGGETWLFFCIGGTNNNGSISNPKIRVVRDGSGNSWLIMMGIWNETGDDILWTSKCRTDGTLFSFEQVATDVKFADLDADVGTGAYAYVTYVQDVTNSSIRAARNAIDGVGWIDDANIFAIPGVANPHPAIAAAASGHVSIALIYDSASDLPEIRLKRSTNYASSWLSTLAVDPPGSWDDLHDVDIAYDHDPAPYTGWITVTFEFTTSDNFGYYLSTNSGEAWSWESLFSSGYDENLGSIRARKVGWQGVTVSYNVDPGDSTMFSWAPANNPTSFTSPVRINDFNATSQWPATAGWNGNAYSGILYSAFTLNYNLMFDYWNNTGIDGAPEATAPGMIHNAPNPFNATTNISFNLTQNTPVTISIYNVAGHLVTTLADKQSFNEGSNSVQWNGQNESGTSVSPGVYFCRLSANGINQTHRMLMVR
ncbi:MAG: T9SS type A sorting domain-containing protein [Candidatus Aegiribacteria sp.]|nr:T9SS type A sorting domain-containing protein [Candidatus Aegiribacteria sp.]